MPAPRNTPEEKRRVRTGCLSCRQRRRKCDEKKPQCSSCDARGVSCKYPGPQDPSMSYEKITFVENGSTSNATATVESVTKMTSPTQASTFSSRRRPSATRHFHLKSYEAYFNMSGTGESSIKNARIRHFQYRTAPWLEVGSADNTFCVAMMRMNNFQYLVAELAARHSSQPHNESLAWRHGSHRQTWSRDTVLIEKALYILLDNLCTSPSIWKQRRFQVDRSFLAGIHSIYDYKEPLYTLVQQQCKLDLAASLLTATPPTIKPNLHSPIRIPTGAMTTEIPETYNQAINCLTETLRFVFRLSSASPAPDDTLSGSPSDAVSDAGMSPWQRLWLRCQSWHDSLPRDLQPLVQVSSIERSRIDPGDSAGFPIHIYTSATAVQAAVFYHIASLLLLEHKPRLLVIPGRRTHLMSQSWHARAIVGLATSNTFPEQWDPITIAALLYVAKDITHISQQEQLLSCFLAISSQTGISLEDEVAQLQSAWAAAWLVEMPKSG